MPNTLGIRRRIRSVKNTRQITKAMELVSAAKMRKAQIQALKSRTYALLAWDMINNLAGRVHEHSHKLLRHPHEFKSTAVILITSNRGLAGNFNNQVINAAAQYIQKLKLEFPEMRIDLLVAGRKGANAMAKAGYNIVADFQKFDVNVDVQEILPISQMVAEKFAEGVYDRVALAYSDFISTLMQKPRVKQILPFAGLATAKREALTDVLGQVNMSDEESKEAEKISGRDFEYIFEPNPDIVLEKLLPRLVEVQIYQAFLENNASEHSARMVAMKSASDAATDIIADLTLEYNQMRQAGITREIAEISAGRMAVS